MICTWCGSDRGKSGTRLCDGCWEIKHRVRDLTPQVLRKALEEMGVPDIAHAYDVGWEAGRASMKARQHTDTHRLIEQGIAEGAWPETHVSTVREVRDYILATGGGNR